MLKNDFALHEPGRPVMGLRHSGQPRMGAPLVTKVGRTEQDDLKRAQAIEQILARRKARG